jgi:hypothetical protein
MPQLALAVLLAAAGAVRTDEPARVGLIDAVRAHADVLIAHGRDMYGPKKTPLFVCQLDVETREIPPRETKMWSTSGRIGAGPTMSNLQYDSDLIRLLHALTDLTGEKKYAAAATEYLTHHLAHLPDEKGNFPWGDHVGYDVVLDKRQGKPDEFKITLPPWDRMYAVNAKATRGQIDAMKLHVIDETKSWAFNRHYPPGTTPHSMNSSGCAYIAAWAFLHAKTGEEKYLTWARSLAGYLWSLRNTETNLLASHPADPKFDCRSLGDRPTRTEYMGPWTWHASNLLIASEFVGPEKGKAFRVQALAFYRAYTVRCRDEKTGGLRQDFTLTGKPRGEPIRPYKPGDAAANWHRILLLLPAYAYGFKVTREADLREAFDTFGRLLPLDRFRDTAAPPLPIDATALARGIQALTMMHEATGEKGYLDKADVLARYALAKHLRKGLFVAGPPSSGRYRGKGIDPWKTYSNRGGSNALALALLRLHLLQTGRKNPIPDSPMTTG